MTNMIAARYFRTEWGKLRWPIITIILCLGPAISLWIGFAVPTEMEQGVNGWLWFFSLTVHKYSLFFYPLIVGVFSAMVCRYEHIGNDGSRC